MGQGVNRRDSIKLMAGVAGGVLLPAGEATVGQTRSAGQGVYAVEPAFTPLRFGEIRPEGWILAQMRRDLQTGFAGHLDELCHEASSDIFATGRNAPGHSNAGNVANDAWWNGESEGNWRCGHMMQACLTRDPAAMLKADAYVKHILASQDSDGYIGIFSPELRYSGNGEFWTQSCLFRGLLAYAEATGRNDVYKAVKRAVDRTIEGCAGRKLSLAGHDAMYADVLEPLYARTGEKKYLDFGLRLYREREGLVDFHRHPVVGDEFHTCYSKGHGPTVAESMRMPFWFWAATGEPEYLKNGVGLIAAMNQFSMPSGALVSEEAVDSKPYPWNVGYEYCAIFEKQFSLINAGVKTGDAAYFQAAEHVWFNAAQGSREPDGSAILYCSYENRLAVQDELAKRQRFSPTHQQVAVCCVPNATRVAPYFVSNAWVRPRGTEPVLAAVMYGPCTVTTQVAGVPAVLEEQTMYPYGGYVEIKVRPAKAVSFALWLRDPEWSGETKVECEGALVRREGSYLKIRKEWKKGDMVRIHFDQKVQEVPALQTEFALQYGPLLYVLPVRSKDETVKKYDLPQFRDYLVAKTEDAETEFSLPAEKGGTGFGFAAKSVAGTNADFPLDQPGMVLGGKLIRKSGVETDVELVPMGAKSTRLRRVTFPVVPAGGGPGRNSAEG